MGSTVGYYASFIDHCGFGCRRHGGAQDAANSADARRNRRHGLELARCGARRLEPRHRRAGRHREHRRADRAADPEDRAVRRRAAERRAGGVRQLRRRRHQRPDDSRPRRVGVEQHADPAERSPHAGVRHQPRARRSEHRRAARARARRGARRRRVVGLRLRCRRGRRQFHHAAQRRRRRSVAADGRRRDAYGTVNAGVLGGTTLGRRLAAHLLQLFRPRQPRSRRSRLRAREPNGARRPRLHAEPLRSCEHHGRERRPIYTPYTAPGVIAGDCDPSLHADLLAQRAPSQRLRDDSARHRRSPDVDRRFDLLRARERSGRAARQRERHDVRSRCRQRSAGQSVLPFAGGCCAGHVVDHRQLQRATRCSVPARTSRATSKRSTGVSTPTTS